MRVKNAVISGPMIMEKFSKLLGTETFDSNNSWLGWSKYKENVLFHCMHGEQFATNKGAIDRIKTVLLSLIDNYDDRYL